MPKNETDKERFAAASSCIKDGDLNFTFPAPDDGGLVLVLNQPQRSRSRHVSNLNVPIKSRPFEAWKPAVSGARVTGKIKMAESTW